MDQSIHSTQEFNKKFRGSDDFKASVAEDKIESFGKVLQKFFDTEREDYKKDAAAKIPDYDYLVKKAGQAGTTKEDASTMSPFWSILWIPDLSLTCSQLNGRGSHWWWCWCWYC